MSSEPYGILLIQKNRIYAKNEHIDILNRIARWKRHL